MNEIKKWYSTSEYVDIETGEIISKSLAIREYHIISKTKKYEIHETVGNIKHTNECRANRQQKLW